MRDTGRTARGFYSHLLYRLFNAANDLLYVGRTNNLRRRMEHHSYVQPWWNEVARSTVETLPDFDALCAAEKATILTEKPRYNIVYNGRVFIVPDDEAVPQWLMISPRVTAAADVLHQECRDNHEANYPSEGPDDSPPCDGCARDAIAVVRAIDRVTGDVDDPLVDQVGDMVRAGQPIPW